MPPVTSASKIGFVSWFAAILVVLSLYDLDKNAAFTVLAVALIIAEVSICLVGFWCIAAFNALMDRKTGMDRPEIWKRLESRFPKLAWTRHYATGYVVAVTITTAVRTVAIHIGNPSS